MGAITGIITLLVVVTLGLLITRVATVALTFTGLSPDLARFQARSAFTGCGFTTSEAESLVDHPVRRRIIMILMLLGNGTVVMAISSLIPVFLATGDTFGGAAGQIGLLLAGLSLLWIAASSKWLDRQLSRVITWALARFTQLEAHDYVGLLHLAEDYTVTELQVREGDWLVGKRLIDLRLNDEGVQVLGIHRADGRHVGTPTGNTFVRRGDRLTLYGRTSNLSDLGHRKAGPEGDQTHALRVAEQQRLLAEQQEQDRSEKGPAGRDRRRASREPDYRE